MASLITLPRRSDAFTDYKPSRNAHTSILTGTASAATGDSKVIRLNLTQPRPPLKDSDEVDKLNASVPLVLAGKPTVLSYHQIGASCRRVVLNPQVDVAKIYNHIVDELQKYVDRIARECRGTIMGREGNWLDRLVDIWDLYDRRVGLLASLFVYLDRVYAPERSDRLPIREKAKELFCSTIWNNPLLFEKTRDDILAWATAEREADSENATARYAVMAVVTLAKHLGVFETISQPYIELTRAHYETVAGTHAANVESGSFTGAEYVSWALSKEEEEKQRADRVLSAEVAGKVVELARHEAGEKVTHSVVRQALDEAMYRDSTDALIKLYKFSIEATAFKVFSKALQDHIDTRIRKVISDPKNDPQMIESTLRLKRFVDTAVAALFSAPPKPIQATNDDDELMDIDAPSVDVLAHNRRLELEESVRAGFKSGLGSRQNAPAEWIAKHLDAAMRKGQGSGTEAEFNTLLDEIIALIGFTKDKDVFRAFYTTGLAKRILLNKSASDDLERNMIVKLQNEMGDEFTSGDVMMKDLQVSETLAKAYQSARVKNPKQYKDSLDFTANVLTESAWPSYPLLKDGWDFKLTAELQASIDAFSSWYATQHSNRQLSWRHQLGTVTLSARFDSGKFEIGVSLFQAVVMLQFNEADVFDFSELKARTGIESSELVRTLQSLALGRKGTRVLLKRPAGKEVEPTDKFAINKAFSSERIKFKINQIQQDISVEESRKTNEQVAIDRVSVLEATIVRIMKAKKKMTLTLLIDNVVGDVSKRFPPDVREIKKRVESLIEREFLQREEGDRNTLHYLA
ncbi:Cullin-4A [Vanrija pseudolonga]|uniref:Cullin-4A n=1 Tax=Vanrija pseudolonga TaxID=143232 RepID=A0AAF0YFN7_9TREE|nr:Cullin-4A [Vanrija pseudolonga]